MALSKPKKQYLFGAIAEFDDGHDIYRTPSFQAQMQVNSALVTRSDGRRGMRNCAKAHFINMVVGYRFARPPAL
jgi:hypothetical protein